MRGRESEKLRRQSKQVGLGKDVYTHVLSKTTFWDGGWGEREKERDGERERERYGERERERERK